jgi:hypothetical protein
MADVWLWLLAALGADGRVDSLTSFRSMPLTGFAAACPPADAAACCCWFEGAGD